MNQNDTTPPESQNGLGLVIEISVMLFMDRKPIIIMVLGLFILALLLNSCGKVDPNQPDCNFVKNVYGSRVSWKSSTPIPIYLANNFPSQYTPVVEAAILNWNKAYGRDIFEYRGISSDSGSEPQQDKKNIIYWMESWTSSRSNEQGLTAIHWVGDQIREADIRINSKNFSYYTTKAKSPQDVHLQSLIVHELGHVLGLKHIESESSVMATFLGPLTERTEIPDEDISSIKCEYN